MKILILTPGLKVSTDDIARADIVIAADGKIVKSRWS